MQTETLNLIEDVVSKRLARNAARRPATQTQVINAVRAVLAKTEARGANGAQPFSLSRAVRGMAALAGQTIDSKTAEADTAYVRALTTGQVPGSYMVPTIQAEAIISQLADAAVARAAGATIWPMAGVQAMRVPVGLASPQFVFVAQNSRQTPTDPNLGQLSFTLINNQALILVPAALFRTAAPQWDVLLEEFFAVGMAESEDSAMHATATVSGGPVALMSKAGITTVLVGGSANGGNANWSDWTGLLQKSAETKVRPPLAWFMSPRTLTRLLSLGDTTSRPLLVPTVAALPSQAHFELLGWPVFLTNGVPNNEVNGSGVNQSHAVLTNPSAIHIGESSEIEMAVSGEFAFDANQIALRVGHGVDFDYQPAASIHVLAGIN